MSATKLATARSSRRRRMAGRSTYGLHWLVVAAGLFVAPCVRFGEAVAQEVTIQSAAIGATRSVDLSPPSSMEGHEALSPEQQVVRGKALLASMERFSRSIAQQLRTARTDRDVVKVLCLNDKLSQVDVALRSGRERLSSLEGAAGRGDPDRSRHEYTVLEVLHDRVRVLVDESVQCVGAETGFIADAEVSVTVDPNLPDANTGFEFVDTSVPPPPNVSTPTE